MQFLLMARKFPQLWRISGTEIDNRELLSPACEIMSEEIDVSSASATSLVICCRTRRLHCIVCFACVLCVLLSVKFVRASMESLGAIPEFTGNLPNTTSFLLHLGGFCFGSQRRGKIRPVGSVVITLSSAQLGPWWSKGSLYLLSFDDQTPHWGTAWPHWNSSAWAEKLLHANTCSEVLANASLSNWSSSKLGKTVNILERYGRHWNFALLGLGLEANSMQTVRYHFLPNGARSSWGPGPSPISRSCPPEPLEFIRTALWDLYAFDAGASAEGGANAGAEGSANAGAEGGAEGSVAEFAEHKRSNRKKLQNRKNAEHKGSKRKKTHNQKNADAIYACFQSALSYADSSV